jgi:hypothetical protein
MVADLLAAARTNLDEHERIWQAIDKLREAQLDTNASVLSLTGAIRDLIDRIHTVTTNAKGNAFCWQVTCCCVCCDRVL